MVTDHSKANAELMKVAAQQNVSLPKGIAPEDKPQMAKLSNLSGPAFDKTYATAMVKDHQADTKDFTKEAHSGKDRATAQFAAKTLPTLQMTEQMAEQTGAESTKAP